jgi:hypothetical protein
MRAQLLFYLIIFRVNGLKRRALARHIPLHTSHQKQTRCVGWQSEEYHMQFISADKVGSRDCDIGVVAIFPTG